MDYSFVVQESFLYENYIPNPIIDNSIFAKNHQKVLSRYHVAHSIQRFYSKTFSRHDSCLLCKPFRNCFFTLVQPCCEAFLINFENVMLLYFCFYFFILSFHQPVACFIYLRSHSISRARSTNHTILSLNFK